MIRYFLIGALVFTAISCRSKKIFEKINADQSGIHFNNLIADNDTFNVLDIENIYNGGGVGIADFNNDGLQDIYFTGNMVGNKLYLNKGNFKFDDITDVAGVAGEGKWSRGVSVVDINNDGLMDMYISATILPDSKKRENLLYINNGINKEGVPVFKNMAAEYGLNDTSYSTMAAFFDYDNDGDLDMYLVVNEIRKNEFPNKFRPILINREHPGTDKFFRNDWNDSLKHPVYTDVSVQAGVTIEGYGHGVNICDINQDGWKDIYVTNDFIPNNILYINNKNGTFTDRVKDYFKHTSANAMGQDIIDINNDGLADVIELDMNPEDNYRKKMMMNPIGYQNFRLSDIFGYQYQYVRNVLQVNQGPSVLQNDSIGNPVFSDAGYLSGIAETDWSWAPVVADFDNDSYRDIIITNGFPKDVTDHDFISFRKIAMNLSSKRNMLDEIPSVKIANYAFKNNGDLTFNNVTADWDMETPSFSNGAAWADLDNDGDLDVVINNINDEAFVYRNNVKQEENYFLGINCKGDSLNKNGLGAIIELHYDKGKLQVYENFPYRGYLSSVQNTAHFGLGKIAVVDSLIIKWTNGKQQLLKNIKANQILTVNIKDAVLISTIPANAINSNSLFSEITRSVNVNYVHSDTDFIDFDIQRLLPHKFSEYGPALAVADIDGNGLDDLMSGGSFYSNAQFFLQQPGGSFVQKELLDNTTAPGKTKSAEDLGVLLFDADADGDQDLYIASGGYEAEPGSVSYSDRFYFNDGKGNFSIDTFAIPANLVSKSCVRAADYDKDGDLDIFIAGRVDPGNYPRPVSSFIYRNDSKNGHAKFTDVTAAVAKDLLNAGMVCDAVFTDFDNDGWPDLVMAGEWMPLTFLKNNHGVFQNVTSLSGIQQQTGWWNSVAPGDFDNDGDIDYIVGNQGTNSFYRASEKYPVGITAADFDKNGSYDAVLSLYLPASAENQEKIEYPAHLKDDYSSQLNSSKKKFLTYKSYANANLNEVLSMYENKNPLKLHADNLKSSLIRNEGNGRFTMQPLPLQAQVSVLNGMAVEDFDGDGNLDVVINGNDYGTEVSIGRYDALNGLFLKGDGKGNFTPLSILRSGIYIPGNGKALAMLQSASNKCLLAASQNRGPLKILQLKKTDSCFRFLPGDVSAIIKYKNGTVQKREHNYGASFLSQSAQFIVINKNIVTVEITNSKGAKRVVKF
jgi:ASPIC and UnbV/FG-GAP-like repeat